MDRAFLNPSDMPPPPGPLSYGVRDDDIVYVSGSVGTDDQWKPVGNDVTSQAERAFDVIGKVLKESGCGFGDVLKTVTYLVNASDYKAFNEVRKKRFTAPYPASTVVVVKELVLPGLLVEIEAIARRPSRR